MKDSECAREDQGQIEEETGRRCVTRANQKRHGHAAGEPDECEKETVQERQQEGKDAECGEKREGHERWQEAVERIRRPDRGKERRHAGSGKRRRNEVATAGDGFARVGPSPEPFTGNGQRRTRHESQQQARAGSE